MTLSGDNRLAQLQCFDNIKGMKPFVDRIKEIDSYPLKANGNINTLQVNVGKVCNLMCKHCHVDAGPHRTELMMQNTMSTCLRALSDHNISSLAITGGAPELNPNLSWFITEAKNLGCHVIVRTNLTVLGMEEYSNMPEFYAHHHVEIVSSLPCFSAENTDQQRGQGIFLSSLKVLTRLNELGYGQSNRALKLNLFLNPGGVTLPPAQIEMESDYRRVLFDHYGISFNDLYINTNAPVGRFLTFLHKSGDFQSYIQLLADNFNAQTVKGLTCREQVSVGWDGQLFDCDFNQNLGLSCSPAFINDFSLDVFKEREVVVGNHCYACTARLDSSCGGAIIIDKAFDIKSKPEESNRRVCVACSLAHFRHR